MIIYGHNSTPIHSKQSRNQTCKECAADNSIEYHFFSRYAHVFWIPFFPLNKYGVGLCNSCGKVTQPKEMDDTMKREFSEARSESRGPIWQFSGIGLIAFFIVFFNVVDKVEAKNTVNYLAEPKVGDVYFVQTGDEFTTLRIQEVIDSMLLVQFNEYGSTSSTAFSKLNVDSNYSKVVDTIHLSTLHMFDDQGMIKSIKRK